MGKSDSGIKVMKLLMHVQVYLEEILHLFVISQNPLTSQYLQDFLHPVYSSNGSNDKAKEDKVVYNWINYIQETAGILFQMMSCSCSVSRIIFHKIGY